MTVSDRDKKILMFLVPLMLVGAYWFLLLSPKREEASTLSDTLITAESRRDTAVEALRLAEASKSSYAKDYSTVVRLGKAIPSDVDMPSLLVQLDRAARGTNIRFAKVSAGARIPAPVAPVTTPVSPDGTAPAAPAADPGGAAAATAPGQAAETAGEGAAAADASASAATTAAGTPPPGTAAATPGGTTTVTTPTTGAALDTVPLTFSFDGRFADLADFFHEMKRFVRVANDRVRVDGRLMKIDGFAFDSTKFPTITANVTATVYLAPKSQGATAGATPQGPAPVTTTTTTTPPAEGASAPPVSPVPVDSGAAQ